MSTPKTWLDVIDGHELEALLRGLYGSSGIIVEPHLFRRILDEKWDRGARPMDSWPHVQGKKDIWFVQFCDKASGPNDPEHRPSRQLLDKYEDRECSCGIRDGDATHIYGINKRHRLPGRFWWPTELGADGTLYYLVCPYAKCADDLDHAFSSELGSQIFCICNASGFKRDEHGEYKDAQRMPAQ